MTNYQTMIKVCNIGGKKKFKDLVHRWGWRHDYQDNGYCQGKLTENNFYKAYRKARKNNSKIFFAHDYNPSFMMEKIIKNFEIVILPIHSLETIKKYKSDFEWFGYNTRKRERVYTFKEFKKLTANKKIWSMGWKDLQDLTIVHFDGLDTTLPSYKSSKGKVILPNGQELSVKKLGYKTRTLVWRNFLNMNIYLQSLFSEFRGYKRILEKFQLPDKL